jgi:uncharacterized protein YkwD
MRPPGDTGEVARKLALLAVIALAAVLGSAALASAATTSLVAPASVCPQSKLDAPAEAQEQAMLCLTNYARSQTGMTQLEATAELEESAADKSGDILRCDSFSHYACGREFTYWMRETGYLSAECWRAGENLAWGANEYGTVTSIFRAWLRSPEHRANLLGEYTQIGINLKVGRLEGTRGVHVWTQHFGQHC